MKRVLRRLRNDERGITIVELITVMAILGTVVGGVLALFTAGLNSDADLNRRFQSQSDARTALDRMRRDAHSACGVASGYTSSSVTLVYPADSCASGTSSVSWCTGGSGTRYKIYRKAGSTCSASGPTYADYVTTGSVFTYVPQNTPAGSYTLARLHVDVPVNRKPTKSLDKYELVDDLVFRNSPRS
jgi:type II secretory pathway pseudopilin PulG